MDPTDIVLVPYDLLRLSRYIVQEFLALTVCSLVSSRSIPKLRYDLVCIILSTGLIFLVFVLCGAPPTPNVSHTVWAAVHTSVLLWLDPPVVSLASNSGVDQSPATPTAFGFLQSFGESVRGLVSGPAAIYPKEGKARAPSQLQCQLKSIVAHSMLAVLIPFPILRLYDRGWQVQRWPVPIVLGTTYGWIAGMVGGTLWITVFASRQKQLAASSQKNPRTSRDNRELS
jgi:hypothetical protein